MIEAGPTTTSVLEPDSAQETRRGWGHENGNRWLRFSFGKGSLILWAPKVIKSHLLDTSKTGRLDEHPDFFGFLGFPQAALADLS